MNLFIHLDGESPEINDEEFRSCATRHDAVFRHFFSSGDSFITKQNK
jgi:hypothetical protein